MRITIANRLHPFSHEPGAITLLAGTHLQVEIFPALIRLYSLEGPQPKLVKEIPLKWETPLKNFTVENNLETGKISVWWQAREGFIRYHLLVSPSGMLRLEADKGESLDLLQVEKWPAVPLERLSFGIHKKQDFDLVRRRGDMAEIWPMWFQLGQQIPAYHSDGSILLLEQCRQEKKPENMISLWQSLFKACFHGILAPRLIDDQYQGYHLAQKPSCSPLALLTEGAALIRSHFLQVKGNEIDILPQLPPEFHCGRMTHVQVAGGTLDLEWTKKCIRRLVFHSSQAQELIFHFRHCKQFRLRNGNKDKGLSVKLGECVKLQGACDYFFDHFA